MTPLRVRLTYGPAIHLFSVHYGSDTCIVLISAPATPTDRSRPDGQLLLLPRPARLLPSMRSCRLSSPPASPSRGTPSASARFSDTRSWRRFIRIRDTHEVSRSARGVLAFRSDLILIDSRTMLSVRVKFYRNVARIDRSRKAVAVFGFGRRTPSLPCLLIPHPHSCAAAEQSVVAYIVQVADYPRTRARAMSRDAVYVFSDQLDWIAAGQNLREF